MQGKHVGMCGVMCRAHCRRHRVFWYLAQKGGAGFGGKCLTWFGSHPGQAPVPIYRSFCSENRQKRDAHIKHKTHQECTREVQVSEESLTKGTLGEHNFRDQTQAYLFVTGAN